MLCYRNLAFLTILGLHLTNLMSYPNRLYYIGYLGLLLGIWKNSLKLSGQFRSSTISFLQKRHRILQIFKQRLRPYNTLAKTPSVLC